MADPGPETNLTRECRAFARYLADAPPPAAMTDYYVAAHEAIPFAARGEPGGVDAVLLRVSRLGGPALRMADAYARICTPTGPLRQKLTLALAILENCPETQARLNRAATGSRARVLTGLAGTTLASALALGFGVLIFGPIQLVLGSSRLAAGDHG
jgi:hypothetical protein